MSITAYELTDRFKRDYRRLAASHQRVVDQVLEDLRSPFPPGRLRHHSLSGYRPTIYVVDVYSNHSYQLTFEMHGTVARLLRIGSHSEIDRSPR